MTGMYRTGGDSLRSPLPDRVPINTQNAAPGSFLSQPMPESRRAYICSPEALSFKLDFLSVKRQ